jgi:Family of unknown function (DUF5681)
MITESKQCCGLQNGDNTMTFKPGQSGNPGGLRKHKEFTDALRMELAALDDGDHRGMRKVAAPLIKEALKGKRTVITGDEAGGQILCRGS